MELLRKGLERGAVSEKFAGKWSKQVCAISDNGEVLEARLDRESSYHGYPLAIGDAFGDDVIKFWEAIESKK